MNKPLNKSLEKEVSLYEGMLNVVRAEMEKNRDLETAQLQIDLNERNNVITKAKEAVYKRNPDKAFPTDKALIKAMNSNERERVQRALRDIALFNEQIELIHERVEKAIESKSKSIYREIKKLNQRMVKESLHNDESALLRMPDELLSDFAKIERNAAFSEEFLRKLEMFEEAVFAVEDPGTINKLREKLQGVKNQNEYQLDNDAFTISDLETAMSAMARMSNNVAQLQPIEKQIAVKKHVVQFRHRLDSVCQKLLDSFPAKKTDVDSTDSAGSIKVPRSSSIGSHRSSPSASSSSSVSRSSSSESLTRSRRVETPQSIHPKSAKTIVGTQKTKQKIAAYEKLIKQNTDVDKKPAPKKTRR